MDAETTTDTRIGYTLLAGLLLSIAVMVIGLIITAVAGASSATVLPLDREWPELVKGNGPAILDLGILLLFASPVEGIIVAILEFTRRGDRQFFGISMLLLIILVIAFAIALR